MMDDETVRCFLGQGLELSPAEKRILLSLFELHRKLDALETSDAALTSATTALGTQLQNFEADITTGLASVVAALKAAGAPATDDPNVDAAVTALNAMGVGITGTQAAFDAAVAAAVPASPSAPVPTPSVPAAPPVADNVDQTPAATDASVNTDTAAAGASPIAQPTLDAIAQNKLRAPEQSA